MVGGARRHLRLRTARVAHARRRSRRERRTVVRGQRSRRVPASCRCRSATTADPSVPVRSHRSSRPRRTAAPGPHARARRRRCSRRRGRHLPHGRRGPLARCPGHRHPRGCVGALAGSTKRAVAKARRSDVVVVDGHDDPELLDRFRRLHTGVRKRQVPPVAPTRCLLRVAAHEVPRHGRLASPRGGARRRAARRHRLPPPRRHAVLQVQRLRSRPARCSPERPAAVGRHRARRSTRLPDGRPRRQRRRPTGARPVQARLRRRRARDPYAASPVHRLPTGPYPSGPCSATSPPASPRPTCPTRSPRPRAHSSTGSSHDDRPGHRRHRVPGFARGP